ncbi:unnamed protein product [Closterium sp. NIES-65]|nr:unnamed protein product [Closterium sp. NIES-65]
MERAVLCWVLILVTLVTGCTATATSSLPTTPTASPPSASLAAFLPAAGGRLPVTSSTHATPLVKGKVFLRYVARLTPPRSNGKVVGDRGATGKVIMKGIKASASANYVVLKVRVNNVRSGGAVPSMDTVLNCLAGKFEAGYEGLEITSL